MKCRWCEQEFTEEHWNQRYCSPECKQEGIRAVKARYKKTSKGIASQQRWVQSDKKKEGDRRARQKPRAKKLKVANVMRYLARHEYAREAKRACDRRYGRSVRGREVNRRACAKYRVTDRARELRKIAKSRRRHAPISDLTPRDWQRIQDYYGHKCAYCGSGDLPLEQDHVIPLSKVPWGWDTISNVVPACRRCNASKNNRTPAEAGMVLQRLPLVRPWKGVD